MGQFQPLQLGRFTDEEQQSRITQAVMNVTPGAAIGYHPGFTQSHQVLGEGSLTQTQHGFKVANTGFAFANCKQDLQARCLSDGLEQCRNLFNG